MPRLRLAPRPSSVRGTLPALLVASILLGPAVAQAKRCPNIMFVVSKAANMGVDLAVGGGPPTRFDVTRQAVTGFSIGQPSGLVLFSSSGQSAQQCALDTLVIPVAPSAASLIQQALKNVGVGGVTNLGDGIRRAVQDGGLNDARRDNVLIVLTAGSDDCHPVDPMTPDYGVQQVLEAARHVPPIQTAIFSFDDRVVSPVLNQMAVAGGLSGNCDPKGNKACYGSGGGAALLNWLDTVIASVRSTSIGQCDDTCFGNPEDCAPGEVCDYPGPNQEPRCLPDPCLNVACGAGQYCRKGQCVDVCPPCPDGTYCNDGQCLTDRCDGAKWNEQLQFCDPDKGVQPNKCTNSLQCPLLTYCDPATGYCTGDPCRLVNCPAHASCNAGGWCEEDAPTPDLAPPPDLAAPLAADAAGQSGAASSDGGCSCSLARGPVRAGGSAGTALLLFVALALLRPRRRA